MIITVKFHWICLYHRIIMRLTGPEPFCGIGKDTYKKEFLGKEEAERESLTNKSLLEVPSWPPECKV